jgi:deoxyribonuclease V
LRKRANKTKLSSKFSIKKACAAQRLLSKRILCKNDLPKAIKYVGGIDVAYFKNVSIGAAAVIDLNSLELIESQTICCKTRFPYVPTLLSFREISPTVLAIKKLQTQPDVFLVDGQGVAHPYRLGFASHLGLVIDKPTIGVAKSLLCGEVGEFNYEGLAPLNYRGKTIGAAIMTSFGRKPIYVSVGHKISLERAIAIVRHFTRENRIPEPILKAHRIANEKKKKLIDMTSKSVRF